MTKYSEKKKSNTFKNVIFIYVIVWLVVTTTICALLWGSLSKYQASYDSAKEASNPDKVMDVELFNMAQDNIKSIVSKAELDIMSRFENVDDYGQFYYDYLEGKALSYTKDEKYNDARPVYDVYADGVLFAKVSMKPTGTKDDYGFSKWTVDKRILSENNYTYHDFYAMISNGMHIFINGYELGESEYVSGGAVTNEIMKYASNLTGTEFGYSIYYAGDMIFEPTVQVLDAEGNDITDNYVLLDNDLRDYRSLATENFVNSVSGRVKNFCETYIYHIYRKAAASDVAAMMVDGSEAERLLYDAQSTLAWAWVPTNVEILSEDFDEFVQYNENYFSCRSNFQIKKWDANQEELEDFSCQWLFRRVGDSWQVEYFTLQ